jgi:dTDP-4-dehydrorhamnose 3,5-epimerase
VRIHSTALAGVCVVETSTRLDHRGSFTRLFCADELANAFGARQIAQINHSRTTSAGAVRGLHFQHPPHAECKLIRCLRGEVFDVALDLRRGSPTFLQWHAERLSADNQRMIVIPEGCAHGFQALSPDAELLYLHSAPWAPGAEGGVRHDDPRVVIKWPLPVADLSERDSNHPLLAHDFAGL